MGFAGQVTQTLTQMQKQEVLIWAPPDREALQRFMAGLQRAHLASRDPLDFRLTLLIALDVLPGCDTAAAVLDIFSHPALDKRWELLRKATQFVLQPWCSPMRPHRPKRPPLQHQVSAGTDIRPC